jgi:hypothetical protein
MATDSAVWEEGSTNGMPGVMMKVVETMKNTTS